MPRVRATKMSQVSSSKDGDLRKDIPICSYCGPSHPSERCNREPGVAARGGKIIRIKQYSLAWKACQPHQLARGRRLGYLAAQRLLAGPHRRGKGRAV